MESSDLRKSLLRQGLPPKVPTVQGHHSLFHVSKGHGGHRRDYSAANWSAYFSNKEIITTSPGNKFNCYENGCEGPILVLLHGGGFSGLTWSLFAADIVKKVKCRTFAIDLRGHGETESTDDLDLSSQTMAHDIVKVVNSKFGKEGTDIILIGHSMGGALAVHSALVGEIDNVVGICVIDVVEGTAMDALSSMQSFLRSRPSKFKSLEFAIEWSVRSAQIYNVESARVSMPGQLKSLLTGQCATNDVGKNISEEKIPDQGDQQLVSSRTCADTIAEEDEDKDQDSTRPSAEKEEKRESRASDVHPGYTWRIDLAKTEAHWPGWFQGLSQKFLSVNAAKLLLLAGVDRLDRDLTIGQMQGKFQMQVLPQAGHAVHEDVPDKVADCLATFLVRNKFAEPSGEFHHMFPAC